MISKVDNKIIQFFGKYRSIAFGISKAIKFTFHKTISFHVNCLQELPFPFRRNNFPFCLIFISKTLIRILFILFLPFSFSFYPNALPFIILVFSREVIKIYVPLTAFRVSETWHRKLSLLSLNWECVFKCSTHSNFWA